MNYNILKYLIGEGFKSILKNKKSTFSALMIMFVTLLTVGLGVAGGKNVTLMVEQLQGELPINVFLDDNISQSELKEMEDIIKSIDEVNSVKYVSKSEALRDRRENLDNADSILKTYTDANNPFPASFIVNLKDLSKADEVIEKLKKLDHLYKNGEDAITTKQSTIENLNKVKKGIRVVFFALGALLVVISIVIIGNTIKLAVHARRKEISIMKYVGATNNFIRAPFIVEGVVIGIFATAISLIAVGCLYVFVYSKCGGTIFDYKILEFRDIFYSELSIFAALGIGIGVLGSSLSMKKYLKV